MQHGDSEIAKIIPFAYQRLPSTEQPSWNSSNIIIFQTIYPLEQKLDGRQQADRFHRNAEIIPLRCQRGSSIEQPSWNSSNIFFHSICPLEQKLDERHLRQNKFRLARTVLFRYQRRACTSYSSWNSSNKIFCDYMFFTVLSVVWDCGNSWSYPLVFFYQGSLVQWKVGLCNATVARLLVSLIHHSLRSQAW